MSVTLSSGAAIGFGSAATTVQCTIASVPAGATIVVAIHDRTDETTTISSISDNVDGAWTLNYVAGPVDTTNGTARGWLAYRNNCTGGTTTITVTFSGSINCQAVAAYLSSSLGAMSFDAAAATLDQAGTNWDSNTVAATGAGAIVGALIVNNSQSDPEPTADGTGESRLNNGMSGGRTFLFGETYASSGSYGLEVTADNAGGVFIVGGFLEPAATTKKLKLLAHTSNSSLTSIAGVVFDTPSGADITGARLGEFTGASFAAGAGGDAGYAVLKVAVSEFGGEALTTGVSTPVACIRNADVTSGAIVGSVIEE